MKITLCGSIKFFEKMREISRILTALGFEVLLPVKVEGVDYWAKDNKKRVEAKSQLDLMGEHFRKIKRSDAILVVNENKAGIANYIGANTFAEIIFAHYLNRIIYFLNPIPDQPYILDEILAVKPVVIKGDLAMIEKCNQTSVGILVWQDERLLLVERARPPFGFAPPAGHTYQEKAELFKNAAKRELLEETGLEAINLKLVARGRKNNRCRRGGQSHFWKIFTAEVNGKLTTKPDEVKQFKWADKDELATLAGKTEAYLNIEISEEEWRKSPGLEPVWYEWFRELNII